MTDKKKRKFERKLGFVPTEKERIMYAKTFKQGLDFKKEQIRIINHYLNSPYPINDCIRIPLERLRALENHERQWKDYLGIND